MSSNNKTSVLIRSQVPAFVRDEHERFVEFLEYYYKFLEQDGELGYVTKNFPRFLDIDEIAQDINSDGDYNPEETNDYHAFLQKLYDNFTGLIPDTILADRTRLLKHAKEFYRTRGSEKSVQFLMRALFNEEVEFYYPKNDILRASDGKWFIEKSLNVKDFAVNNVANSMAFSLFTGRTIRGANSNSTCTVEAADQYYDNGVLVTELKVSAVEQDFENGEKIYTFFEEDGEVKQLSCNLFSGIIISATVTESGSGYIQGAGVPIESNSGSGGIIIISKVAKANLEGKIKSVTVTLPGAGFRVNDQLLFTGGGGKNAAAIISSVNEDETFHPASYSIVGSRIIDLMNMQVANTTDPNEGFAYTNLATQWTNTSNLTVSTIPGANITEVTLSGNMETSNVYFETGDVIVVANTERAILESNRYGVNLTIASPGLPGSLSGETLIIKKKPNANTTMANSLIFWAYNNCGPIVATAITNPGSGYFELPTVDALSNSFVRSFGILGRMEIVDGGLGYQQGDVIEFINQYGDYGEGANAVVTLVDANGVIQQVTFYARDGYNAGGAGYSMLALPTANVVTTTGNGANIMVTAIIGDGELLEATSNVIGSVERLRVLSGGAGYLTNPTLNLASQGDGTAQAFANIVTGIYTYPGRYINDDGHLSGYNFIQDRDYYQPYSYVIKSDVSLNKYRKAIKELAHPAGMKLYGQHVYQDSSQHTFKANIDNAAVTTMMSTVANANLVLYFDVANTLSYIPSGNYNVFTYDARTGTSNTAANIGNIYYDTTNVWYNAANTNNFGTLINTAHFRASGVMFNGVYANDAVRVTHTNDLNTASIMTFITWFYAANTTGNKYIASKVNSANNRGFRMFIQDSNLKVSVGDSTTDNVITIGTVNTNTWYQAAFTYEGINLRGYMNGEFRVVSSNTSNANTDTGDTLFIGSTNGYKPNTFHGKIAMTQIYDRRLSNNEIINEFNNYRKRFSI